MNINKNNLPKRKSIRNRAFSYNDPGAYFVTICTRERQCLLSTIENTGDDAVVRLTHYGKTVDSHIRKLDDFYENISVEHYVIMPNHVHLLIVITDSAEMPSTADCRNSIISKFLSTLKRFCNKDIGKNIWQSRSFDHVVRNRDDYTNHVQYISENPARWYFDKLYCPTDEC